MATKKTTPKKSVKKGTSKQLKITKAKRTTSNKSKASSKSSAVERSESVSKSPAIEQIESLPPREVQPNELQVNSCAQRELRRAKKTVVIKDKLEWPQVVTCLENILAGVKAGTLCVQHGDEFVTLKPGPSAAIELEATVKKGKERLSLQLTWRTERVSEGTEFRILSTEPIEELAAV